MLTDTVIGAIKRAAHDAADKGVEVKVEINENGFFPTERTEITITCTPQKKETP